MFERLTTWLRARRDARLGIEAPEASILAQLGVAPAFDPAGNLEHSAIARDMASRTEVEEIEEDIRRAEDAAAVHQSPFLLAGSLVLLFAAEVMGCSLVMRALGLENPDRLILSMLLSAFAFFVTSQAARQALATDGSRRPWWFYVLLGCYGLFVVSVTILRVDEAMGDADGSIARDIAAAVVLASTTVGPAWLAEWVVRLYISARRAARELRLLRRRHARKEAARRRAERYVNGIERRRQQHAARSAQLRALYEVTHLAASARAAARQVRTAGANSVPEEVDHVERRLRRA